MDVYGEDPKAFVSLSMTDPINLSSQNKNKNPSYADDAMKARKRVNATIAKGVLLHRLPSHPSLPIATLNAASFPPFSFTLKVRKNNRTAQERPHPHRRRPHRRGRVTRPGRRRRRARSTGSPRRARTRDVAPDAADLGADGAGQGLEHAAEAAGVGARGGGQDGADGAGARGGVAGQAAHLGRRLALAARHLGCEAGRGRVRPRVVRREVARHAAGERRRRPDGAGHLVAYRARLGRGGLEDAARGCRVCCARALEVLGLVGGGG